MAAISAEYDKNVKPWLELAEDLRALSLDTALNVPQICVMGDQSSGKSSVLEALSGVPFPRGSGLVTRCPVRLVMRRADAGAKWSALASTSNSSQQIAAESPGELTAIIARLTESLTMSPSGFSSESIIVQLSSPESPDLTVIDLPGIVRTVTAGQTASVISDVNTLIDSFLEQERTIILAVIPANQDIATVDILERAMRVDPTGERTIGVLTKPDLIGPGNEEEVVAVLTNVRKPLKLGYIMVKNRSQLAIKQNMTGEAAKAEETKFFATHPVFSRIDPRLVGVHHLTVSLSKLLVVRIQTELAPMKRTVETLLSKVRADVRAVSSVHGTAKTAPERQKLLVTLTQGFVRHLNDCVRGEYRDRIIVCNPNLRLYTRALVVFSELQSRVIASAPLFRSDGFVADLARQMEALRGRELPGFMSAQSFYMFIQEFIDKWTAPAHTAAAQMRALANEVVKELFEQIAISYPHMRSAFENVASVILEQSEDEAIKLLDGLVAREKDPFTINEFLQAHINKLRYDRFETAVDASFAEQTEQSGSASWQATKEHVAQSLRQWYRTAHGVSSSANAEDMSAILEAYWTLASKRFVDNACMCLDDRILGTLCAKFQEQCYHYVHDEEKLEHFFTEDAAMVAKRQELEQKQDRLTKANAAMANIQATLPRLAPAKRAMLPQTVQRVAQLSESVSLYKVQIHVGAGGLGLQLADEQGLVVTRGFRPGSAAQQAGILLGDNVLEVGGKQIPSFAGCIDMLKAAGAGTVVLTVKRET